MQGCIFALTSALASTCEGFADSQKGTNWQFVILFTCSMIYGKKVLGFLYRGTYNEDSTGCLAKPIQNHGQQLNPYLNYLCSWIDILQMKLDINCWF